MFSAYYQSELSYLRELGREFARLNPALAEAFGAAGTDPDVERLLEGFAFLTARIRERLDDALPQTIASLAELVAPHALRSFPACTVVAFFPDVASLRGRHTVPPGTELASRKVRGTTCRFRTVDAVDLVPLRLVDVELDRRIVDRPALRLRLQTNEAGRHAVFSDAGFRFVLAGAYPQACTLALWLSHHLDDVRYEGSDCQHSIGSDAVKRATIDEPLAPWPRSSPHGLRWLQEYCAFPRRFLLFDITRLNRLPAEGPADFSLVCTFRDPPELPEPVGPRQIQLHATPAVNLFSGSAVPVRDHWTHEEVLLRADGIDPRHAEVFSVDDVRGVAPAGKRVRVFRPFYEFRPSRETTPAFSTRRTLSPVFPGFDTYLRVTGGADPSPSDRSDGHTGKTVDGEVLSVALTCTNRDLADDLNLGDLCVPTADSPAIAPYSNVVPVSKSYRHCRRGSHWRLIGEMTQQLKELSEPGVLTSLLALHESEERAQGRVRNDLLSNTVRALSTRSARRSFRGASVGGFRTEVELDERRFAGVGDAAMFASVLDELFADRISLNTFHELRVRLHPSGREWAFAPRGFNSVVSRDGRLTAR